MMQDPKAQSGHVILHSVTGGATISSCSTDAPSPFVPSSCQLLPLTLSTFQCLFSNRCSREYRDDDNYFNTKAGELLYCKGDNWSKCP